MIVVWRVTTHCNLSCPFCAYDRRLALSRTSVSPERIRYFCEILAAHQRATGRSTLISWLGGEPLLWKELPALSSHASALGLRVSTTTNGTTLASRPARQHLLDHYAELTISLDALGSAHDALRGWPGGFNSLQNSIPQLVAERRAQAKPLKLRINSVLLRSTIERFPALAREVAAWGIDELTFNLLGGRDRPEFFPDESPLPAQLESFVKALPSLRRELTAHGLAIAGGPSYLQRLLDFSAGKKCPVADCAPGENFLFIDELGRISPCSFTSEFLGVHLDQIQNQSDLAALPAHFRQVRSATPPAICQDCPSTHIFAKFTPAAA